MTRYETLFLLQPGLTEERAAEVVEQFAGIIPQNKGSLIRTDNWGKRRLAYPVESHQEGYYSLYEYDGEGETQRELERRMRLSEDVIRFMTTRVDPRMEAELARRAERDKRMESRGDRSSGREDREGRDDGGERDGDGRGRRHRSRREDSGSDRKGEDER